MATSHPQDPTGGITVEGGGREDLGQNHYMGCVHLLKRNYHLWGCIKFRGSHCRSTLNRLKWISLFNQRYITDYYNKPNFNVDSSVDSGAIHFPVCCPTAFI